MNIPAKRTVSATTRGTYSTSSRHFTSRCLHRTWLGRTVVSGEAGPAYIGIGVRIDTAAEEPAAERPEEEAAPVWVPVPGPEDEEGERGALANCRLPSERPVPRESEKELPSGNCCCCCWCW